MTDIKAKAVLNLKERPIKINIDGSISTKHDDDIVTLKIAEFQGINPSILLCDLEIIDGKLPIKLSRKRFRCEYDDDHAKDIKEVTIRQKDEKDFKTPYKVVR